MNNLPQQKLILIIRENGHSITNNPQLCKAFLLDYCGEYRGEIKVLMEALNEGIVTELLNISQGVPKQSILAKLKNKLTALNITEEASQWAVETWALALGVVTESELNDTKERSSYKEKERQQCEPEKESDEEWWQEYETDIDQYEYSDKHKQPATIYVGNLHNEIIAEDIKEVFSEYGHVEQVDLKRGYAFVKMANRIEALNAINTLDGAEWMGRDLKVESSFYRQNKNK